MKNPAKVALAVTLVTLSFMVCWGAEMTLLPIKTFWRDEWCLIYNLKFKSPAELWGPLDFTQQFPRVYLQLIKAFTSGLHYSYFSLRFPAFAVGTTSVLLGWRLMRRLYPRQNANSYLLLLILVSDQVFMDYYVQMKHYEMEILLSLTALWQLLELLDIAKQGIPSVPRYLLLCLTFLTVPYFSYTYPIAVAPVLAIAFVQGIALLRSSGKSAVRRVLLLWFPLMLCAASIFVFYLIDVSQLMADEKMNSFWHKRLNSDELIIWSKIKNIWAMFAKVGSGYVFEIVFGILGLSALFYAVRQATARPQVAGDYPNSTVRLYCLMLLALSMLLGIAGKLPVGEPKFNAFLIPAISILIIFLLDYLCTTASTRKFAHGLVAVLYLALVGNIVSSFTKMHIDEGHANHVKIFRNTGDAITLARQKHLPILITPGIGRPDSITAIIPLLTMPDAAGVLKTHPAYRVNDSILVYAITNFDDIPAGRRQLPPGTKAALVGNGMDYTIIHWP